MSEELPRSRARLACDLLGVLLAVAALFFVPGQWDAPLVHHDEGIVLTESWLVAHGEVPHRDFYSCYPPGVPLLVTGLWQLTGESIHATRALGLAIHALIAIACGLIAGRVAGRRFSWLAAGGVLLWWRLAPLYPFAWSAALAALLFAFFLLERARERGTAGAWIAAGACLGLVGCLRHDLFVYAAAAIAAVALAAGQSAWPPRERIAVYVGACCVPLALVWGWVVARAGIDAPLADLVYAQTGGVQSERALPLPDLWPPSLPTVAMLAVLGAPLVAGAVWARNACNSALPLALGAALAVLPQALGRSDLAHLLDALPPGLALLLALGELAMVHAGAQIARVAAAGALLALTLAPAPRLRWMQALPRGTALAAARCEGLPERDAERAAARDELLAWIAEHTRRETRLWVGTARHDAIEASELDLHYLTERRGAARVLQLAPGHADLEEVQRVILDDFERYPDLVIVLCDCCGAAPRAEPTGGGSRALDLELAARWRETARFGPYRILQRTSR